MRRAAAAHLLAILSVPFSCMGAIQAVDTATAVANMQAAWAQVSDYRVRMVIRTYGLDGSSGVQIFYYTFKKPNRIRLDFIEPHQGMILIFPDKEGKVFVRPAGLARLFRFHLQPDSRRLLVSAGQRIDQTDLGLLITNIARSLTDWRRGPALTTETDGLLTIQVAATDHFRPHVVTLYKFSIDRNLWLPREVEESTLEGRLERTIAFCDLEVNIGVADAVFQTG